MEDTKGQSRDKWPNSQPSVYFLYTSLLTYLVALLLAYISAWFLEFLTKAAY